MTTAHVADVVRSAAGCAFSEEGSHSGRRSACAQGAEECDVSPVDRPHNQTVSVLKGWRATQNEKRMKVGEAWERGEWTFTDNLGQPWRPDGITRRFVNAANKAGLPPTDIKGLRHAHVTALLKAGVHPKVV